MGKVLVKARIENVKDLYSVKLGLIRADRVRAVEVEDAVVDSGAVVLSMPSRLIAQLGLDSAKWHSRHTRAFEIAKLTIQGRDCVTTVLELPDDSPVLIGSTSCLAMDWVVDPKTNTLGGNPAHGGEWMVEAWSPILLEPEPQQGA